MPKRKRAGDLNASDVHVAKSPKISSRKDTIHLQIVTGSYERILHGITAAIPRSLLSSKQTDTNDDKPTTSFTDTFLMNAHTSAIKCLAVSPSPPPTAASQKVILATGSSDEKINLFHLSTRVPKGPVLPGLGTKIQENSGNRSLGTLYTHDAAVTALQFPNRSKLLSSCGNNVIAVTSTKTFNTLSLIKAPNPKHPNRPTGDTSTASTLPNGVNDFAVHPSMKLMISVGRAEKNMRLWNLVTGRKAGVLAFDRDMLKAVGEGTRWGSGEGRRVLWSPEGEEFAVAFERGICVFGMVCLTSYMKWMMANLSRTVTHERQLLFHQPRNYIKYITSPATRAQS
jgi:protein MAK11